ncbi:hypothetical protein [Lelliottia aquatilis]|uniref:hypothetical protein n=1 Tax=Lelliottia aquatilis TaxID=2080838 RepID=UPI00192BA785|nr:hypothetical protein [Lelliottia aquatilis]MBL5882586.1 hypothetical protein [Lelliottia aquatilis]
MASNNLWTIINEIQASGEITQRHVCKLLGCNSKKACRLLEHLNAVGAVKNIGRPRRPIFILQPDGETGIKLIVAERHKPGIAEICRQNWKGYQIHKIIRSAQV